MWRAVLATTGSSGLQEEVGGVTVLDVTAPSSLAVATEDGDEPVVVVSHPVHAHAARVACATLAGHRPSTPVTHLTFSQAPLANLVTLGLARELARDAGHGVSVWRDLSMATWSAVALSSVTKLTRPNPTVRQHLRSLFPGSQFLVRLHPEPEAVRAQDLRTAVNGVERGSHDLYVSEAAADSQLVDAVVAAAAPPSVRQLDIPGDWRELFGRTEQMQLAMVPSDYKRLLRPRAGTCRSCGLSTAEAVCDFCRIRTRFAPGENVPETPVQHVSVTKGAPMLSERMS